MPIIVTGGVVSPTLPSYGYTTYSAQRLIEAVARFLGRFAQGKAYAGTTTTARLDDQDEADDYWRKHYLYCLAGGNADDTFHGTAWVQSTKYLTFTRPSGIAWANNDTYRLTPFDPRWMLTQSVVVRGVLDRAVDLSYDTLIYSIANDDLTITTGLQEYSFRVIGTTKTWIEKLRQVQYRSSTTSNYYNARFSLVGDDSFLLLDTFSTSYIIRLLGDGPVLRSNLAGTVISALVTETDNVVIQEGHEALIVGLAAKILLEEHDMPFNSQERDRLLALTDREIPALRQRFYQSRASVPLRGVF